MTAKKDGDPDQATAKLARWEALYKKKVLAIGPTLLPSACYLSPPLLCRFLKRLSGLFSLSGGGPQLLTVGHCATSPKAISLGLHRLWSCAKLVCREFTRKSQTAFCPLFLEPHVLNRNFLFTIAALVTFVVHVRVKLNQ